MKVAVACSMAAARSAARSVLGATSLAVAKSVAVAVFVRKIAQYKHKIQYFAELNGLLAIVRYNYTRAYKRYSEVRFKHRIYTISM